MLLYVLHVYVWPASRLTSPLWLSHLIHRRHLIFSLR
jgi:hypothetical protein